MESHKINPDNPSKDATRDKDDSRISQTLSPSQLHALFDILTHHGTYDEVESFKDPGAISKYGYPFGRHTSESDGEPTYAPETATPLLAVLLRSIVLTFPGIRDLPPEVWHVQLQGILENLARAELSEAYDKGGLGLRKSLATAASAIHETLSRGILGGLENRAPGNLHGEYDRSKAEDLARAWEDGVHGLVYGDLVEELFTCAQQKKSLEEHSPGVQAAADYSIIYLATLLHHIYVLSPEAPYLLKHLENVHKLLPYALTKQTLRIGNAASMLNGMMRLMLAKVGVGALSNWFGITQNADDGMNLLQRIIWLVLSWDASEFRKTAESIEKTKGPANPSKEQLAALKDYTSKSRAEHLDIREASAWEGRSIVATILERSQPAMLSSLSETQHAQCSAYLSASLAVRDRDEISNALCRQNPDVFTRIVRNFLSGFEPMIRTLHQNVDLREHLTAGESLVTGFINVTRGKKTSTGETQPPTVEDYALLLHNNRHMLYNWLHQVASQCPDIREEFRAWAKETIKAFRQSPTSETSNLGSSSQSESRNNGPCTGAAGALSEPLQELFTSLPPETQTSILPSIDAHAAYLSTLKSLSLTRMQRILDNMPAISAAPTWANTANSASTNTTSKSAPTTPPAANASTATSYFSPSYWSRSGRSTPRSVSPNPATTPRSSSGSVAAVPSSDTTTTKGSQTGPGVYLSRWQQLMDDTVIGPGAEGGSVRRGADVKGLLGRGKTGAEGAAQSKSNTARGVMAGKEGVWDEGGKEGDREEEREPPPVDVKAVVEALGDRFKALIVPLVEARAGAGVP
ncbi:PX-associated-domain-containing protein [Chaetomium sp. MPI-SDFR-AT-0129]|nr:PX-associated-domain-containing protein [Chaetomium sp. MPI-SDFR-AT-0129]